MNIDRIHKIYFIGIGGIGMSALARYFNSKGKITAGYDLTRTPLTDRLADEGIDITFVDNPGTIPSPFLNDPAKGEILIVYTPAIPAGNRIFRFFNSGGYTVLKRSALLGKLFNSAKGIAVAGTHGKTSVSAMIAHLLNHSPVKCNAFLGGIAVNYDSNLIVSDQSGFIVAEADEYDRSFLQLLPQIAVITSMDPDHLDVYGTFEEMKRTFARFAMQVKPGGSLIARYGLEIDEDFSEGVDVYSYGPDQHEGFSAKNIRIHENGLPVFDFTGPGIEYRDLHLGIPGRFNIDNSVAAMAAATVAGVDEQDIRKGLESFRGIYRRFEIKINTPGCVLIDDYAHHPAELDACISAVREIFKGRRITGVFQPHLYSRTRDFADGFAVSLEALDELILLDIYPAREIPLPGVSSKLIFDRLRMESKIMCTREELPDIIKETETDVVLTLGAGNIDAMVEPVKEVLLNKIKGRL